MRLLGSLLTGGEKVHPVGDGHGIQRGVGRRRDDLLGDIRGVLGCNTGFEFLKNIDTYDAICNVWANSNIVSFLFADACHWSEQDNNN